ncbi:hypothetical protein [Butyrivibrio sp. VCD2006]|nr:hypothetical protein [Butyrivibrio sp. VCD2006]
MKKTWNDASLIELDMTATATEGEGYEVDPSGHAHAISGEDLPDIY